MRRILEFPSPFCVASLQRYGRQRHDHHQQPAQQRPNSRPLKKHSRRSPHAVLGYGTKPRIWARVYLYAKQPLAQRRLLSGYSSDNRLDFTSTRDGPRSHWLAQTSQTYEFWMELDRKSTRLNSSHSGESRMPSSA